MGGPPPTRLPSSLTLPIGVILTLRPAVNPLADPVWRANAVMLEVPAGPSWRELSREDGSTQYLSTQATLELFRKETQAYIDNLESREPSVYVVLRESDGDAPITVHLVTASPFEAQDYMDSSEELVERIPMPAALKNMIQSFVEAHHVEEKFRKRARDEVDLEEQKFGKEPIFAPGDLSKKGRSHDE